MIKAMIAGERDPQALAALARGRMQGQARRLAEALDGMFDAHHGELAAAAAGPDRLPRHAEITAAARPGIAAAGRGDARRLGRGRRRRPPGPAPAPARTPPVLTAVARLAEIPGISEDLARAIIAEIGLDMSRFPDRRPPGLLGRAVPVRPPVRPPAPGPGRRARATPTLRGALGQAAFGAARTDTFLGERYRRIARRRGKAKAQVAVARSILIIIWHLLADPAARYTDLGPGYYQARTDKDKKIQNHIRQIEALLGHPITITNAA